ncbi:hypothetical protein JTE90_003075 [Oedothorax gibbosus]|uniref:Uncharacterized protein n=1 Tax=Oedothorax gibbosus TaxID=931172 RepID=A0AAV6TR14_9ARAC|nr:hypothetical protein JTE90_003075 [Oedothorax gibbosus]
MYYPVPFESIRTLLSPQSSEFDIDFFHPQIEKVIAASIEVFKQELLTLKLKDFYFLLEANRRRFIIGNELNMEPASTNDFKKLCEGSALNVRVKYCADRVVFKTPT